MRDKSTHIMTLKEFLESKKKEDQAEVPEKKVDWNARRVNWIKSIDNLYKLIDDIIVSNLINSGYNVEKKKEEVRIVEDYIGAYTVENYIINADNINIILNPIGTIIIGAYGRVNMVLPKETVKLVLHNWDEWKIVSGFGNSTKLIDFNEQNILRIFKEYL